MKTLLKTKLTYLIITGLLIALVLLFINFSWSIGFLLGFGFSFITIHITESQIDSVLFRQKRGIHNYIGFIIGNLVYLIPFLLAIYFSEFINVIFVAFGLLYFKYFMYIQEIFFKKRESNVKQ